MTHLNISFTLERLGHIAGIEQVQRRAARFVSSDYRYTSQVTPMLQRLGWESLERRRQSNRLVVFYKAINNMIAIPTSHLSHPTRITRSSHSFTKNYTQLPAHCDSYKYSFFPRTICDWNDLSSDAHDCQSIDSFRLAIGNRPLSCD